MHLGYRWKYRTTYVNVIHHVCYMVSPMETVFYREAFRNDH